MTRRKTNNGLDLVHQNFKKLSIQVSLDGLSFCVLDTVSHKIEERDRVIFTKQQNPMGLLHELKHLLNKHGLPKRSFDEVVVVHRNKLYTLVPRTLFDESQMDAYLSLNIKTLSNDLPAFDGLQYLDINNVYIPYMNINNFLYGLYGEFTFMHSSSILLDTLIKKNNNPKTPACYVHVGKKLMDITIIQNKKLLLHNSFSYLTKEDFAYYLLFVLEQLALDPQTIDVKCIGDIEEDDAYYGLCRNYIKKISVMAATAPEYLEMGIDGNHDSIDFTIINAL